MELETSRVSQVRRDCLNYHQFYEQLAFVGGHLAIVCDFCFDSQAGIREQNPYKLL